MKVCLFGGSFDPVHTGHVAIAEAAQAAYGLERVVFLPAARSPFKAEGSVLFSDAARVEMLHAAVGGCAWAEVSELDLHMPPPSWSWRLVDAWLAERPQDALYWLLGTDQWELLHEWARPEYLAEKLTFIVYHRGAEPKPRTGVRALFMRGAEYAASSSEIRTRLLAGEAIPEGWLHPAVEAIARRSLAQK